MIGTRELKLGAKWLVTAAMLWLAFRKVDLRAVSADLAGLNPLWAAAALAFAGLTMVADAMLLSSALRLFDRRLPFAIAFRYSLVGWFFSNLAPSTFGGDIFRGVQLARVGMPGGAAARLILSIRLLSYATLVMVIAAGFPIAATLIKSRDLALLAAILAGATGALGGVLLLAHFPRSSRLEQWPLARKLFTLSADFRRLLTPGPRTAAAWLEAAVQHVLRVGVLACLAAGLGLIIPTATLFALTPAALLVAMIPVSIGSWGVREVSFVYLLGAAAVSAEAALSLSIMFGLLRLVVGAFGGVAWALMSDRHYRVDAAT